ncbi:MAG: winged helix-turn-helix domain-containing protein [Solirubrobacterales bacterium]
MKALAHPLRVQILAVLSRRSISPAEFSRESGEPLSDVSYHFRKLEDLECAEVVKTIPVRGSTQHFYRATKRPLLTEGDWKKLPLAIRGGITATILQTFVEHAAEAIVAGTYDARDDSHLSWTPMVVDEEGWRELAELLKTSLESAAEIEVRAARRMAKSESKGFSATFALASFESPKP